MTTHAIKTEPKRIAKSTGKPDQRQHDNKKNSWQHTIVKTIEIKTKKIELIHSKAI